MYQAAIVEDETAVRTQLRDSISAEFQRHSVSVAFDLFADGNGFLEMFGQHYHYDMIFLDIEMPGIDGIEVCRQIRRIDADALVVFVSNRDELVFQSFEVQPFRFIRKSHYQDYLVSLAEDLLRQLDLRHPRMIRITEALSGDIFSFNARQILYIEAQRKDCRIVTDSGATVVRCRFMELETQLSGMDFIKIHRSYLVNCHAVFYIGKSSLILTDKTELPVSRNRLADVKKMFLSLA